MLDAGGRVGGDETQGIHVVADAAQRLPRAGYARPPHLVAVGEREDSVSSSRTELAREEAERRRGAEDDLLGAVFTEQLPRPAPDRRRGQQRTRKAMEGERETRVVRAGGGLVALCTGEHDHTVIEEATDVANECLDTADAGRKVVRDDERRQIGRAS